VEAKQQLENLRISTDLLKGTRNRKLYKMKMKEAKIEPPVISNVPHREIREPPPRDILKARQYRGAADNHRNHPRHTHKYKTARGNLAPPTKTETRPESKNPLTTNSGRKEDQKQKPAIGGGKARNSKRPKGRQS